MAGWTFDPRIGAYRDPDGQARDLASVRDAINDRVNASRDAMRSHARDLAAGKIDAKAFEARMRQEIKTLNVQSRVIGSGGRANVTQSGYGKTGAALRREYRYLGGFVADIESGRHTPAGIEARAAKYAGSNAIQQFEDGRLGAMKAAGYTEKRFTGPNDDRTCPECKARVTRGWVPIDEPGFAIGDSTCQAECRHQIEYRKGSGAGQTTKPAGIEISEATPDEFAQAMKGAHNSHKAFVSPVSADDLREMNAKCFLTGSGDAGYYMRPDGYLGGLFNGGSVKGAGHELLLHGVENGASSLDCFDGYLSGRYSEYGFRITERYPWNDEFAPDGWNYDVFNHPDYVDMEWQDGDRMTVRVRHKPATPLEDDE